MKLAGYVPVLHRGYKHFFETHRDADELLLFGTEILSTFPELQKNLPALLPEDVQVAISSWQGLPPVRLVNFLGLEELPRNSEIILPDEDISRTVSKSYLTQCSVGFDSIFLRRDKQNTLAITEVVPGFQISCLELHRQFMHQANTEAEKSSDFFRQVGALIARDGVILVIGHNRHVPSPQTPYAYGDPRANFKKNTQYRVVNRPSC